MERSHIPRTVEKALEMLHATNNLPEDNGTHLPGDVRILLRPRHKRRSGHDPENELAVIEHAFRSGLIKPRKIAKRTGKKVAVIGSGPAGLSARTS